MKIFYWSNFFFFLVVLPLIIDIITQKKKIKENNCWQTDLKRIFGSQPGFADVKVTEPSK